MSPPVWEGLKRVIRNREIRLEDPSDQAGMFIPQGLRPEPVPLDVKVIVTGDEMIYRMLTAVDNEDFWDLFKVKAEFDHRVGVTDDNLQAYCSFICRTCEEEGLMAFEAAGAAKVIEFAARLAGDQEKLSTRFGLIKDLLIEADYWARKDDCLRVQDQQRPGGSGPQDLPHQPGGGTDQRDGFRWHPTIGSNRLSGRPSQCIGGL